MFRSYKPPVQDRVPHGDMLGYVFKCRVSLAWGGKGRENIKTGVKTGWRGTEAEERLSHCRLGRLSRIWAFNNGSKRTPVRSQLMGLIVLSEMSSREKSLTTEIGSIWESVVGIRSLNQGWWLRNRREHGLQASSTCESLTCCDSQELVLITQQVLCLGSRKMNKISLPQHFKNFSYTTPL